MQFYGISFVHPYKQSGRWQDVFDISSLRYPAHPAIGQTAFVDA
jgi:hypothetical protein